MATSPARRARLREKHRLETIENQKVCEELKSRGSLCSNCKHLSETLSGGYHCDLDSDFYGYSPTTLTHTCKRHARIRHGSSRI
jgi:hypothetical protein